ncbi:hypothetical protein [Clostridium cylindrosporum]|uniref:Uncharacterized protein n=1 Tax=Clostridium cylindrosporum DSM 605 TaxID=1121307 RepID=A0A0J8DEB3_CLOCY|nr:hypothetical protein [Clostridium cylindrosporum]KMT22533.1 hypothetical protein CLCY_10c00780 [Clostridium cylindrosporum DSM 605]
MTIKKFPKFIIITVLSSIVLLTAIISLFFNSNNEKSIDITSYSIYSGKVKLKEYENLESLENEMNFKLLHSNYFSNNNFVVMCIRYNNYSSEIYQVPKSAIKAYKKKLDAVTIGEFLGTINEAYAEISVLDKLGKDSKLQPAQFLGEYEILKGYPLSNGQETQLVKQPGFGSRKPAYTIAFNYNQAMYAIRGIPSQKKAKEIVDSYVIK